MPTTNIIPPPARFGLTCSGGLRTSSVPSYILVESFALVQHRLGIAAVRVPVEDILPALRIHWVSQEEHQAAVSALLPAGRRDLSVVDCVSFDSMRRSGVTSAFTFDRDFEERGFRLLD